MESFLEENLPSLDCDQLASQVEHFVQADEEQTEKSTPCPKRVEVDLEDADFRKRYKEDEEFRHSVIASEAYYHHNANMVRSHPHPDEEPTEEHSRLKNVMGVKRSYVKAKLDTEILNLDVKQARSENINHKRHLAMLAAYANKLLELHGEPGVDWLQLWAGRLETDKGIDLESLLSS